MEPQKAISPKHPIQSTLRPLGLEVGACTGLTLSVASLPRLQRPGLAPPNGSTFPGIQLYDMDFFLVLASPTKGDAISKYTTLTCEIQNVPYLLFASNEKK